MSSKNIYIFVSIIATLFLLTSCERRQAVSQDLKRITNQQPTTISVIVTNYVTNYISTKPAATPKEIYKMVSESIVLIKNIGENGEVKSVGSGFYIENGDKIATNFHVIEGANRLEISDANGSVYFVADVVGVSRENDIAILMCPPSGKQLTINTNLPDIGDHIITLGNPKGLQRTISDGLISGIRQNGKSRFYQMSAPISPGSSGGPVLNDRGEVIGVSTFTFLEAQNINFAVPSKYILELVNSGYAVPLMSVSKSPKNTVLLGRKGLEVIKSEIASGDLGVSIKNHTEHKVNGVWVRIEFFEKPAWADTNKLEEFRREIAVKEKNLESINKSISDYNDKIQNYQKSKASATSCL
jgi:S1-C subfamily serine protease